jgi:hypothetical protein
VVVLVVVQWVHVPKVAVVVLVDTGQAQRH